MYEPKVFERPLSFHCHARFASDANKQNSMPQEEWDASSIDPKDAPRAVREYIDTLEETAFGAASEVEPKFAGVRPHKERWHKALKSRDFLQNDYLPGASEQAIGMFIDHYKHHRRHENPHAEAAELIGSFNFSLLLQRFSCVKREKRAAKQKETAR